MREQFGVVTPERATWSAEVWPDRTGLVVYRKDRKRIAEPMRWGIPHTLLDGVRGGRALSTSIRFNWVKVEEGARFENPWRCLIIMDSFARTRTWYGLEHQPVFAWAGVWAQVGDEKRYCGLLAEANLVVSAPSMPVILDPDDYALWLGGRFDRASPLANRPYSEGKMYMEALGEPWNAAGAAEAG